MSSNPIIAYLEPVIYTPAIALDRAVCGFRQREKTNPHNAAAADDVALPSLETLARLGLEPRRPADLPIRSGHVIVWSEAE